MIGWSLSKPFALPIGLVSDSATNFVPNYGNASLVGVGKTRISALFPYSVKVTLSLEESVGGDGVKRWRDYKNNIGVTKTYDLYEGDFSFNTLEDDASVLEELINGVTQVATMNLITEDNFYPLTLRFGDNRTLPIVMKECVASGSLDYWGKESRFRTKVIYASNDQSNPIKNNGATVVSGCVQNVCQISYNGETVQLPQPQNTDPVINSTLRGRQTNGGYDNIVLAPRLKGSVVKLVFDMSEEQAKLLLDFIVDKIRGKAFTFHFPKQLYPFGRKDITSATCVLFDKEIMMEHQRNASVLMSFRVQMID
jgi:hypothetical protein